MVFKPNSMEVHANRLRVIGSDVDKELFKS